MKTCKREKAYDPLMKKNLFPKKEAVFLKRNYQLMKKKEIDALVEFARNEIVDNYYDLEN